MNTKIGGGVCHDSFNGGFVEPAAIVNGLQQQTSVAFCFDPSGRG